jgi:hypothetical protein
MNLPKDFDSAKGYNGQGFTPLSVGPHCCRIIGARCITTSTGSEMLEVAFDISEGGADDGRFNDRFQELRKMNPQAKWPNGGMFRTGIITRDGNTNTFFKGLITAVEESNAGYSFKAVNCNEATLKDKMVGFNFGEEDYKDNKGEIRTAVKPFYAVSIASARAGMEPPKKRAYKPRPGDSMAAQGFTEVPADEIPDLPF